MPSYYQLPITRYQLPVTHHLPVMQNGAGKKGQNETSMAKVSGACKGRRRDDDSVFICRPWARGNLRSGVQVMLAKTATGGIEMSKRAIQVCYNDRTKQFGIILQPSDDCPFREMLCLPSLSRDEYLKAKARGEEFRMWLVANLHSHYYDEILIQGDMGALTHSKPTGFHLRARRWHRIGNEAVPDINAPANMEMIL